MIRKLPQSVINKIAAGQVIQRPYNVIKQLIQNSVDAGATSISVKITEGGIKSIEITDNGSGIQISDFPLLCERFATSKLSQINDLEIISSFGFRGEALASLSYVSNLKILSKYKDQSIGYQCEFKDQKMIDQPIQISMNKGTKIIAFDLFGNLQARRSSLIPNEEKKRIIKLINHFALHYNYIKFTLQSEKGVQFCIDYRNSKVSEAKMKIFKAISSLPFDKFAYLPKKELGQIKIEAIISKLNTVKSKELLLNINNRIVQNSNVFKAVEKAYSECYQSIHEECQSFFVYLSIQIDQKKIDCNQHPSKKVIGFLGADKIFENIYFWIIEHIKEESSIKNMGMNNSFKNKIELNFNKSQFLSQEQSQIESKPMQMTIKSQKTPEQLQFNRNTTYAYDKKRTDSKQLPINFYLKKQMISQEIEKTQDFMIKFVIKESIEKRVEQVYIRQFFQQITYVGCFNLNYIFVQYQNKLFMMNTQPFISAFINQWIKNNLIIVKHIVDQNSYFNLKQIIHKFLKNKKLEGKIDVELVIATILTNIDSIYLTFGIKISKIPNENNGFVESYPILSEIMVDSIIEDELAYFLCRLFARKRSEIECSNYFVELLSSLFVQEGVPAENVENLRLNPLNDKYSQFMRDQMIPLLKTKCRHYSQIPLSKYMHKMLDLKDVYQIFQRC